MHQSSEHEGTGYPEVYFVNRVRQHNINDFRIKLIDWAHDYIPYTFMDKDTNYSNVSVQTLFVKLPIKCPNKIIIIIIIMYISKRKKRTTNIQKWPI